MLSRSCSFVTAMALAIVLPFAGCSSDSPTQSGPEPADVNTYVGTLPAWSVISPPMADADAATGTPTVANKTIDGGPYECTTTPYSITRTPDRVVTLNPDVEILWVGALLQGKGHLGGIGQLGELPIRQRAPLALSIDLLTEGNTQVVDNPTVATVTSGIGQLIEAAQFAGHTAGSNIFYTKETAHSFTQAALSMGLSGKYMGASIKAALSANISSETRTVTAYFVHRMFNVSMVIPQTPDAVFSDAFTQSMLQEQIDQGRIGADNPPVYVSSVAYGRILMFSFTSSASMTKINATLEALYNGGEFGGSLSAELQQVLDNASIQVVTVGGDPNAALALIRANNLDEYFAATAPLTTARPISYTVRNLADNSIASVGETTDYNLQQCVPAAVPVTGGRYEIKFTKITPIEMPNLDPFLEGQYNIELQWTIRLETIADGTITVTEFTGPGRAAVLGHGQTHFLPANATSRSIHFDGRDYIRIHGEIRDQDDFNAPDKLPFYREFRYPAKPIVLGEAYVNATDSYGNIMRLYFTITKVADLDD